MNWQVFSTIGYLSVGLWLLVPVLWGLHLLIRPRRWIAHVAVGVAVCAIVLAEVNSAAHVNRIAVDRSAEIEEQMSRQALARQAAQQERESEVAQIRFPEDNRGDFLDTAGLDDSGRAYFDRITDDETPAWKQQKRERTAGGGAANDLESMIDGSGERGGVETAGVFEAADDSEPILMPDADKALADRLDFANLRVTRAVLLLACVFVLFDYVRRLNSHRDAYFPLPLPSAWPDALNARPAVLELPDPPRRSLVDELRLIVRRGESFVYLTDRAPQARAVIESRMHRLPAGVSPVGVLNPGDNPAMDDEFVFETLWFGRNCFVIDSPERAATMLGRFITLLEERRRSRAHTRHTVNIVWDLSPVISETQREQLAALGQAVGFTLVLCPRAEPAEAAT